MTSHDWSQTGLQALRSQGEFHIFIGTSIKYETLIPTNSAECGEIDHMTILKPACTMSKNRGSTSKKASQPVKKALQPSHKQQPKLSCGSKHKARKHRDGDSESDVASDSMESEMITWPSKCAKKSNATMMVIDDSIEREEIEIEENEGPDEEIVVVDTTEDKVSHNTPR